MTTKATGFLPPVRGSTPPVKTAQSGVSDFTSALSSTNGSLLAPPLTESRKRITTAASPGTPGNKTRGKSYSAVGNFNDNMYASAKTFAPLKESEESSAVTNLYATANLASQTLKQNLCVEMLTKGFVHSFIDFFYLTHQVRSLSSSHLHSLHSVSARGRIQWQASESEQQQCACDTTSTRRQRGCFWSRKERTHGAHTHRT